MSVKILSVNPQCSGIENEGAYCYCQRRSGKDVKSDKSSKGLLAKDKLIVDLGPPLKEETFTTENRFSVYLNCGAVSVESKECWDITIINSETPNRQYKNLTIDKAHDNPILDQFEGVFRILPPKQNDFELPPIHCSPVSKRSVDKKLTFRLVFQPELPFMVYNKVFNIWVDNIPIRLKVRGFSQGPSVCLSQNLLNFGGVFLGQVVTLYMELHNHSETATQFQFDNDNMRGVFQICPLAGNIEPMKIVKVTVTFNPFKPNSFYKRVYCLVHHQDPQFIDLIGVSVLKPKIFDGPMILGVNSSEAELIPFPSEENKEYFGSDGFWGIRMEKDVLDFGFKDAVSKENNAESEPLTLNVTSDLPYDTRIEWSPDSTNAFIIDPPSQILSAYQSVPFQVQFRPGFPESFYDGSLECYIYPIESNWSEEGPPWIYVNNKKQLDQENKPEPIEEAYHHENADILRASHSVALKDDVHHHTLGRNSNIHSVAVVRTENNTSGAEIPPLPTEAEEFVSDVFGKKSAMDSQLHTASHAHFFRHQHIHHEHQSEESANETTETGIEGTKNSAQLFEMQVSLTRLNASEPVIFSVDPVGDVTYVIPMAENKVDEDFQPHEHLNKNKAKLAPVPHPQLRKWSRKVQVNPMVSESVLRKPGTENLQEAGSTRKSSTMSRGDGLRVDISTMMPSVTAVNSMKNCQVGAGDSLRLFGLPSVMALPLCLSIKVTGHSFSPSKFAGIPDISMPSKALMYSTLPLHPVCRSLLIKNNCDLPIYFNLESIDGDDLAYKLKPAQGLVPGKCHQIVLILLNPSQPHSKVYTANCNFKVNMQDSCQLDLLGSGEVPTLAVKVLYESSAKGQEIVCLPTSPGCISKTFVELENTSGFHYRFWLEPADWTGNIWKCITPEPANGYIAPYEKCLIAWTFAPKDELTYYVYWRFCFDVIQNRSDTKTSFTGYEFIIPLTGAGKHGSLIAEPGFLDFDMVPIFEKKTKCFSIVNQGAAPFSVNLIICHEQWLRDFCPELITISPTTVILMPHQSVLISVTVRPTRANIQNFYIIYEWNSSDSDTDSHEPRLSDIKSSHLLDITFMGDHAIFKAMDIMMVSRHPIWDARQCFEMFSMERLNQLMIPYSHTTEEGTLPNVSSVTFRFPPAPVDSEPSVFQILLSNTSDLKGYWDLLTTPPKNRRQFGSPKELDLNMIFHNGQVKDNPDLLARLWTNKFRAAGGKENLCDLHEQGAKEQFRGCLDSVGNKSGTVNARSSSELFHISEMKGCINNKDSKVITFKYNFQKVGYHKMTVLLRVYPGIFIWIDLSGRTLTVDQPYLQLMYKHHMTLHPVSAADLDPPVQMFWLYNGGNIAASFSVDVDSFEDIKEKNFGHAVIECLTTLGTVRPKSWFAIKLRFSPLEYADYSIPLKLIYEYSDMPVEVLVTGSTALNTTICLRPKGPSAEFRSFVIYDHAVPISLSPPHIAIPHFIPTGHKVSSCVFLTNLHTQNSMLFRWPEMSIEGGGSITFQPDCGRIPPRGETSCLVIVQAGKVSATFSGMIRCMFEDENEKIIYEFVLSQWEKEEEKGSLLDSKYPSGNRVKKHPKPEPPKRSSRLLAVSVYIGSVFGQYDSIPPKERSRMSYPNPVTVIRPLPYISDYSDTSTSLVLSNFEREMSEEVISSLIWDIVQGPGFASFVRQVTKRNAPFYEDYKECEKERRNNEGVEAEKVKLQRQPLEEVLEATIYNLVQEMSTNYIVPETRDKWFELPQLQPQAFVDIDKYKDYL